MTSDTTPKAGSAPFALAYWFVTEYHGRKWTETDKKGQHLGNAKNVLADYSEREIKGCLLACRDGRIPLGNNFVIEALTTIRRGEPPYIEQYRALASNPPPEYMQASHARWAAEFDPNWQPNTEQQQENPCPRIPQVTSVSWARLHMTRPTTRPSLR